MNFARTCVAAGLLLLSGEWAGTMASHAGSSAHQESKDRARVLLAQALPALDGSHLKATLVEVRYGPGEASPPHSHPCALIGYVTEGSIRSRIEGEPERTYKTGESFYEAPNGVHAVSANASATEPAKLLAYFICDRETALSVDGNAKHQEEGEK